MGVDRGQYLTVSVDAILVAMAARDLIPAVEGLSLLEAAGLVHAEAQFVAKRLALRALADGRNLLFDMSMASPASVQSWLAALHRAGYAAAGVFADIGMEESVHRTAAAHRRGLQEHRPAAATAAGTSRPTRSGPSPIHRSPPRRHPHRYSGPARGSFLAAM